MRLYFNSFSEMLIPTSLWEQTRNEKLEIFSAMDAAEIRDLMVRYVVERKSRLPYYQFYN